MKSECLAKVTSENLKRNFMPHALLTALLIMLIPVIFSIAELDSRLSAQPLEMYLSLSGIIVFTPIFLPEQNKDIYDTVRSKKLDCTVVYLIRLAYSIIFLVLVFGGVILYMKHTKCDVGIKHFISGLGGALFLGAVGLSVSGMSENAIAGYMSSFICYILNYFIREKMKIICIFSISYGFDSKPWVIYGISVLLIAATFIFRHYRDK